VDESTITNWEKGHTAPRLRYFPEIIRFLGYDPFGIGLKSLGKRLLNFRRIRGIKQEELARRIGIDPTTLSRIERGQGKSLPTVKEKVKLFFRMEGE